jgi:hypothetical protein
VIASKTIKPSTKTTAATIPRNEVKHRLSTSASCNQQQPQSHHVGVNYQNQNAVKRPNEVKAQWYHNAMAGWNQSPKKLQYSVKIQNQKIKIKMTPEIGKFIHWGKPVDKIIFIGKLTRWNKIQLCRIAEEIVAKMSCEKVSNLSG